MLFQPYKSDIILAIIKDVQSHAFRNHWTQIKNSEVKICTKINMGTSIIFIHLVFQAQDIPRCTKEKLCQETHSLVVIWISVG